MTCRSILELAATDLVRQQSELQRIILCAVREKTIVHGERHNQR